MVAQAQAVTVSLEDLKNGELQIPPPTKPNHLHPAQRPAANASMSLSMSVQATSPLTHYKKPLGPIP